MKAGFAGLGALGKAIARRLIVEGVELIVWNRTAEKTIDLGVETTDTPAGLLTEADIIFLNLFDSTAVEEVLKGQDGLLEGDCRNKVIVDMTTNHYTAVTGFYRAVADKGGSYVECPVLGSLVPASQGSLTLLVGGRKDAVERITPFVEKVAQYIFYFEEEGLATKMKLINNLVLGAFMTVLGEALSYGEAAGLSRTMVLDILAAGAGNSAVLTAKKEKLLYEDFQPHFSVALIHKDLNYLKELVADLGVSHTLLDPVMNIFNEAMKKDAACLDFSSVYKILKEAK